MKKLSFLLVFFLISCASAPEWTGKISFSKEQRRYFTGSANIQENNLNQAREEAIKEAKKLIAREMGTYIKAITEIDRHSKEVGDFHENKKTFRDFTRLESEEVIEGARVEENYQSGEKFYVLLSLPEGLLKPTQENFRRQAEGKALHFYRQKKWTDAARALEVVLLLGNLGEKNHREILKKLLLCYEQDSAFDKGIRRMESFLSLHPQSQARSYFERERERFIGEMNRLKRELSWGVALTRLKILFRQYRKVGAFRASSLYPSYKVGAEIVLKLHSSKRRYWHGLWIDDDGIYIWEKMVKGDKGFKAVEGSKTFQMGSGTCKGPVLLLFIASENKLEFPCSSILYEKLKAGVQEEKLNLVRLLEFLKEELLRKETFSDLVGVEFE